MNADAGQTAKHDAARLVRAGDAVETPDTAGAYPRLSDEQLAALRRHGERRDIRPGDVAIAGATGRSRAKRKPRQWPTGARRL